MHTTIVDCARLAAHPEWRVVDCRHDLADPGAGRRQYRGGHLPGAVHAHLDDDLSAAKTGRNGRHPLPQPSAFLDWLGRNGIRPSDQVVAYDASGGMIAARLWWMLHWVGHRAAAVLDGGLPEWQRLGYPLTAELPSFPAACHPGRPDDRRHVRAAEILDGLAAGEFLILDARAGERFEGLVEPLDPRAGHIPGAVNRPYTDNLDAHGRFKRAATLRAEFEKILQGRRAASVIGQCGSGVTACHNLLALEVAGMPGARLYPGSWSEWCSDASRPMVLGPGDRGVAATNLA